MPSSVADGFPLRVRFLPLTTKFPRHVPRTRMVLPDGAVFSLACRFPPALQFTVPDAHAAGIEANCMATKARSRESSIERPMGERIRSRFTNTPKIGSGETINRDQRHPVDGL